LDEDKYSTSRVHGAMMRMLLLLLLQRYRYALVVLKQNSGEGTLSTVPRHVPFSVPCTLRGGYRGYRVRNIQVCTRTVTWRCAALLRY
jgi:hypothetical protein